MPVPAPLELKLGVHPRVCCPKYIRCLKSGGNLIQLFFSGDAICFPSDPWCDTYQPPKNDYEYEYEGEDYLGDYSEDEEHTMSDKFCSNGNHTCVAHNQCPGLLDSPTPRIPETCGFDTEKSLLMVCCPTQAVAEVAENLVQKPR